MKFILSLSYILVLSQVNGLECSEKLSDSLCHNTSVTAHNISCYGYGSCYSSELTAISSINCGGYYGCLFNKGLESTNGNIYCDGTLGCALTAGIQTSGSVYCDGELGCFNALGQIEGQSVYC